MRLAYAEQLLGVPGFAEHFLEGPLAGHQSLTWVEPECYVHAVVDPGGVLRAYSVTTRQRRFAPTFLAERTMDTAGRAPAAVRLGRTPFADVGRDAQPGVYAWLGANRWHYSEGHYFGNPGYYLHYVYSLNQAGLLGPGDESYALLRAGDGLQTGCFHSVLSPAAQPAERFWADPEVRSARTATAVNTLTVVDKVEVLHALADAARAFGPVLNEVRVVPSEDRVGARPLRRRVAARLRRLRGDRRAKRSAGGAARVSQGC